MAEFVKVATTAEFGDPSSGKLVEVAGRAVALFQVGGKYYAIEDTCTQKTPARTQAGHCRRVYWRATR